MDGQIDRQTDGMQLLMQPPREGLIKTNYIKQKITKKHKNVKIHI